MATVRDWLDVALVTDDPAGDLIADMKSDSQIPRLFGNIDGMRSYLIARGDTAAIAAVPAAWRRYKRWMDRHPFSRS